MFSEEILHAQSLVWHLLNGPQSISMNNSVSLFGAGLNVGLAFEIMLHGSDECTVS